MIFHWKVGYPNIGGDEYPSKEIYDKMQREKIQERGAWPGNDTIWRMVCDLYNAFSNRSGKNFTIIDGIIGGEGQGPFCPNSINSKTLLASEDLLLSDIVATRYMGINPYNISYLNYFIEKRAIDIEDIEVFINHKKKENFFNNYDKYLDFAVKKLWENIKIFN